MGLVDQRWDSYTRDHWFDPRRGHYITDFLTLLPYSSPKVLSGGGIACGGGKFWGGGMLSDGGIVCGGSLFSGGGILAEYLWARPTLFVKYL